MPRYRYVAFDATGARESGNLDVASEEQAWHRLVGMGLTVVELVKDETRSQGSADSVFFHRQIPVVSQAELAEQMAVLYRAQLTDLQIVRTLLDATSDARVRRLLTRMHQLMEEGQLLPEAFAQAGQGLSPLFASVTRIGQAGRAAPKMMATLAATLRRQEKIAAQVGGALVYPLILMISGLIVFLIVTTSLAPELETIFRSVNRPVPGDLAAFVFLGKALVAWGPVLAACLSGLVLAAFYIARAHRRLMLSWTMGLPVLGAVLRDAALARLTGALALLLRAGVPAAVALRETADTYRQQPMADTFREASAALENGRRASATFAAAPAMPALLRELYAIGETTNTLPDVLDAVTAALEGQSERRIQRLMALLTPALTLVIGGGIAFLVYSVMGALLSINELSF